MHVLALPVPAVVQVAFGDRVVDRGLPQDVVPQRFEHLRRLNATAALLYVGQL